MPATVTEARDQMAALFKAAVDASGDFSGTEIFWDDVAGQPSDGVPAWARYKVKHSAGGQDTIGKVNGKSRYRRQGVIVVQTFTKGGDGLKSADSLVAIILAAYEGKTTSGGLIFRNGRFQEVGQDGPWFQTNVFVDFEYDEVK